MNDSPAAGGGLFKAPPAPGGFDGGKGFDLFNKQDDEDFGVMVKIFVTPKRGQQMLVMASEYSII